MAQRPTIAAPLAPQRGMRVFTLDRREYSAQDYPTRLWGLGTCHAVSLANGRSFYTYADGRKQRRLLVEWTQWLSGLQRDHWVWLLDSDTSPAGWQLLCPLRPAPLAGAGTVAAVVGGTDRRECDQRFQRAVRQVLAHYQLERGEDDDGAAVVSVCGGGQPYLVRVRLDGAEPPACTCPAAIHRRPLHGGFCKHTVAVLMRWPDLRCQLLRAIL